MIYYHCNDNYKDSNYFGEKTWARKYTILANKWSMKLVYVPDNADCLQWSMALKQN